MTAPGDPKPNPELLAVIYDNMSDGVVATNSAGKIIFCNQAMGLLTGRPIEELMGKSPEEAWGAKGKGHGRRLSSSTLQQVIQRPDGSSRTVTAKSFGVAGQQKIDVAIYRDVTRILNAKKAQERSESLFNAFMENSPSAASIKDEVGRYVFVNNQLLKVFGRKAGEWVGKTDHDLWPETTARTIRENDQEVLEAGASRHFLESLPHSDGTHQWLSLRFLLDLPGEGRFISTMSIDITQQREAEEEVEHRLALEAAIAGVSAILSSGDDERVGEALGMVGQALGVDRVTLYEGRDSGQSLFVLSAAWSGPRAIRQRPDNEIGLADLPWWNARLREESLFAVSDIMKLPREAFLEREWFLRGDIHALVVAAICGPEGAVYGFIRFDVMESARTWSASDLRLLGMLGELFSAHMERMQHEAELLRTNRELQKRLRERVAEAVEKRQYFDELRLMRSIVVNANDIVLVTDAGSLEEPGPRIVFVNEAFTRTMGYCAGEVIGRSPRLLQGPGTDRQTLDRIRRALQGWEPVTAEVLNYRKNGEPVWIELSIFPVMDEAGSYTHWVGIQRDVTVRKQQEDERARLMERAEQERRLESLEILAGGIAHEFNNLLVGILGNANLAGLEVPADSGAWSYLAQIEEAGMRAANLTRQLLSFTGQDNAAMTALDLSGSLQSLVALIERQAFDRGVHLSARLSPDLPAIMGDLGQVRQMVMNLLTNAFESMDRGGEVTLVTEVRHLGDRELEEALPVGQLDGRDFVVLRIEDNGRGMEPEVRRRMFEPFFTTKASGRGLGLSAVLGIIRGHGGGIRVSSEVGKGTVIELLFLPGGEMVQKQEESESFGQGGRGEGLVLVVDDDDFVRHVAQSILEKAGFEVIAASDGVEGLAVFEENADRLKAMIVDIKMPRMSGDALLLKIRTLGSRIPIILSSGYSDVDPGSEQVLDEWSLFLAKPYRPARLISALQRLMGSVAP